MRVRAVLAALSLWGIVATHTASAETPGSRGPRPVGPEPSGGVIEPGQIQPPYHGSLDGIAFGGEGELRLGNDRVAGEANPDWFSVGRINGFASARLSSRLSLIGQGAWDRDLDDFTLERAELAMRVKRSLRAHAGIFLAPLGRTNLEHDATRNEFPERSLLATGIVGVPNAMLGAGISGPLGSGSMTFELDAVTGYDDGLINDAEGGTRLPSGRNNYGDRNGTPALVGRLATRPDPDSELGIAAQSGIYNETEIDGVQVDHSRWVHVLVADGAARLAGCRVSAEAGSAWIDVPPGLRGLYATWQWGGSVEAARALREPIWRSWRGSSLVLAVRADAVDFDRALAGDSRHRISVSLNIRRQFASVTRFGWYYEITRDRFDNETPKAGLTLSMASYF